MSDSLRTYRLQHTRHLFFTISQSLLNSCPPGRWCHPTSSSATTPFLFGLPPFPASGSWLLWSMLSWTWEHRWLFGLPSVIEQKGHYWIHRQFLFFNFLRKLRCFQNGCTTVQSHFIHRCPFYPHAHWSSPPVGQADCTKPACVPTPPYLGLTLFSPFCWPESHPLFRLGFLAQGNDISSYTLSSWSYHSYSGNICF